jgi:flagellin
LSTVGKIIDRMSELRTMAQDVTKNTGDIENYSKEFIELQRQLQQIKNDTFNGISLFANSAALASGSTPSLRPHLAKDSTAVDDAGRTFSKFSRTLYTHADGQFADGNVSLGVTNMQYVLSLGGVDTKYVSTAVSGAMAGQNINLGNINKLNTTDAAALTASIYTSDGFLSSIMFVSVGQFTNVIERLADARAENGAELSRLNMTNELLIQNQTNLEAAHGRIMDADIALESTRFARQNVLVQASAAMVAQANQLTSIALQILG